MNNYIFRTLRPYVKAETRLIPVEVENDLLAGSPPVQPGGGGNGKVGVEPPKPTEDEELFGAKAFFFDSDEQ